MRIIPNGTLYINGEQIKLEKEQLEKLGFSSGYLNGGAATEKDKKLAVKVFKNLLSTHRINLTKAGKDTISLMIDGFHQFGYLNALQNACTMGITEGSEGDLVSSATRQIHITQAENGEVDVTEKVGLRLISEANKDAEMDRMTRCSTLATSIATQGEPKRSESQKTLDTEFPVIANIQTTYSFSKARPDTIQVSEPTITRYSSQDKHNSLSKLPDDRNLLEKIKEWFMQYLSKTPPELPPPSEDRTAISRPKY